jgi:hypothetical protein
MCAKFTDPVSVIELLLVVVAMLAGYLIRSLIERRTSRKQRREHTARMAVMRLVNERTARRLLGA